MKFNHLTLASLFLCLSPFSNVIFAGEKVDAELTIDSAKSVTIKVQRGQLKVSSWQKNHIKVTGERDDLSQAFIFKNTGSEIIIEDKLPRSYQSQDSQGSNLQVLMPAHLLVRAEGVSSDVDVSQFTAGAKLNSVSGNLSVGQVQGDSELRTVSGNIISQDLSGELSFETVSGNIHDKHSQGQVQYRLVSGNLNADSQAKECNIDQVSGQIKAKFDACERIEMVSVSGDTSLTFNGDITDARFSSISGDLDLTFNKTTNLSFDIDGGPGGDIDNRLTQDKPSKHKYTSQKNLSFKTGLGQGSVRINTISGEISLRD
jgi:DUF4097 and DUF4098 domain-containing protein YvlB